MVAFNLPTSNRYFPRLQFLSDGYFELLFFISHLAALGSPNLVPSALACARQTAAATAVRARDRHCLLPSAKQRPEGSWRVLHLRCAWKPVEQRGATEDECRPVQLLPVHASPWQTWRQRRMLGRRCALQDWIASEAPFRSYEFCDFAPCSRACNCFVNFADSVLFSHTCRIRCDQVQTDDDWQCRGGAEVLDAVPNRPRAPEAQGQRRRIGSVLGE